MAFVVEQITLKLPSRYDNHLAFVGRPLGSCKNEPTTNLGRGVGTHPPPALTALLLTPISYRGSGERSPRAGAYSILRTNINSRHRIHSYQP